MKINLGWISELRTSNDRQNCQVLMSISCSENRRREVSLFCVQTVGYLLETSKSKLVDTKGNTWIVAQGNRNKRVVDLSTNIKNQMLTTLHLVVQIIKYLNKLKTNFQVTKFQYRISNFYYNSNCILEGLFRNCSHQASKKGDQAKTGREEQKE